MPLLSHPFYFYVTFIPYFNCSLFNAEENDSVGKQLHVCEVNYSIIYLEILRTLLVPHLRQQVYGPIVELGTSKYTA
jgi:hypothetical protein